METRLIASVLETPEGREADAILRACVHCGFCTATCPTYQLLGDELDGPRGRIYLIKQALEGGDVTAKTQLHLDRCLTCRSCETTCPSGVRYGRLVDIGRKYVDDRVGRAPVDAARRSALRRGLLSKSVYGAALTLGRFVRPFVPRSIAASIPQTRDAAQEPTMRL
jgi:glycolate oxidase iron-sulfur subunit